jgi:hypothetical protein
MSAPEVKSNKTHANFSLQRHASHDLLAKSAKTAPSSPRHQKVKWQHIIDHLGDLGAVLALFARI